MVVDVLSSALFLQDFVIEFKDVVSNNDALNAFRNRIREEKSCTRKGL
jgi:hypothetical protein